MKTFLSRGVPAIILFFFTGVAALAEDAYIESSGAQYIQTGYCANPRTRIVCDFAYTSMTLQQRIFGADDGGSTAKLSCSSYINGKGQYAWAFQDGVGNWTNTAVTATTDRRTIVLDSAGSTVSLLTDGAVTYTAKMTTTRTVTSIWPLAIFECNKSTDYSVMENPGSAKLYSFAIYENGRLVHCYKPYRSADESVIGLKDLVTGEILQNAGTGTFTCGGDISDDPSLSLEDVRIGAGGQKEFRVRVGSAAGGSVSVTRGGVPVTGDLWVPEGDTEEIRLIATADEGTRFLQWYGDHWGIGAGYASGTDVTLAVTGPMTLTAQWVTPKTRYWNPTTKDDKGFYRWGTADNWLDETGAAGKPLLGDSLVFGSENRTSSSYRVSDDNVSNPLYEVRFDPQYRVTVNQGCFALLAGGRGLQYLRNESISGNWVGLRLVGDGEIPVHIANNVTWCQQKSCRRGTLAG